MNQQALFAKADFYKNCIQQAPPLQPEEIKGLDDYFRVGLTYTSNALEGNTLTISETKVLLEDGLTVGGKPLKDAFEAVGHAKAYDYMLHIARQPNLVVTEYMIQGLHRLFYTGIDQQQAGRYRELQLFITGTEYLPPQPQEVPQCMERLVDNINGLKKVHPIEQAALAHKWLVDIHPFQDGNGRTARLLMNLILINQGYGVVTIPPVRRLEYIEALRISQRVKNPDNAPFIQLMAECVLETEKEYCRMLNIDTKEGELC